MMRTTTTTALLVTMAAALFISSASAWVPPSMATFTMRSTRTRLQAIEAATVESLENHEEEGTLMAESIARWLDAEWMPQEVHMQMGLCAKESYIKEREAGNADIMTIMMTVADDLSDNWQKYDKDAFVNAYDIANYVSDYLVKRSGQEACDCSAEIF